MKVASSMTTSFLKGIMALAVFSICFLACEEDTPTIKKVAVKGITVEKDASSTLKGSGTETDPVLLVFGGDSTVQFIAKLDPENASNKGVFWSSKNEEVAKVNNNGKVTGRKVAPDVIEIIATTQEGSKTASVFVKVVEANPATKVTISGVHVTTTGTGADAKKTLTLEVGKSEDLTPGLVLTNSGDGTDVVKWTSSDENVATVDINGNVTAKAVGTAKIAATANKKATDTVEVTVTAAQTPSTAVAVTSVEIMGAGLVGKGASKTITLASTTATLQLSVKVLPANATDKDVDWESSDKTKATVSPAGLVTGLVAGTATITAKSKSTPSVSATLEVTVPVADVAVTSVEIMPPSGITFSGTAQAKTYDLPAGTSTLQLTATVLPSSASQEVTWTVSGGTGTTVVNGLLDKKQSVANSILTVTATSNADQTKKATLEVTVK